MSKLATATVLSGILLASPCLAQQSGAASQGAELQQVATAFHVDLPMFLPLCVACGREMYNI